MRVVLAVVLLGVAAPAAAQAKIEYSGYEGPEIVENGSGGTKITRHGIDYWTSGTPPRRYQVIGRISDRRSEEMDGGHAIGSKTVARKVKAAGGSAVILLAQNDVAQGSSGIATGGLGSFLAMGSSKTTTTFTVVKYLD